MANDLNGILGGSAEDELKDLYHRAEELLYIARSKYEDISKLLIGLAAGILSLSISFSGNLTKGSIPSWGIIALLFCWIALIISILFGLYVLYTIYRWYRNLFLEHKDIARTGDEVLAKAKPTGILTFEGLLSEEAKALRLTEVTKWPLAIQFAAFGIGVFLMLLFGILKLISL